MPKVEKGQSVSVELKGVVRAVGHVDGEDEGHCDLTLESGVVVTNVPTNDIKIHTGKKPKDEEKEEPKKK